MEVNPEDVLAELNDLAYARLKRRVETLEEHLALHHERRLWIPAALISGALLLQWGCPTPRYDWRHVGENVFVRIDRWGDSAEAGTIETDDGWRSLATREALRPRTPEETRRLRELLAAPFKSPSPSPDK